MSVSVCLCVRVCLCVCVCLWHIVAWLCMCDTQVSLLGLMRLFMLSSMLVKENAHVLMNTSKRL